jgi:hypothetical protein
VNAGKTAGPFTTLSKNISKKEHQHRDLSTALRFGRDDKGEGRYGPQQRSRDGQTADLSTALRFARDDKGEGRCGRSRGLGMGKPQVPPQRSPGFPVVTSGVDQMRAALSTESRKRGPG